eukprot:316949_1
MQSKLRDPNLLIVLPIIAVFCASVIACFLTQLLNISTTGSRVINKPFADMFRHGHCSQGQFDSTWRCIHLFGITVASVCIIYASCLKRYYMNKLWKYPALITALFVIGSLSYIALAFIPYDPHNKELSTAHFVFVFSMFVMYDVALWLDCIHWIRYNVRNQRNGKTIGADISKMAETLETRQPYGNGLEFSFYLVLSLDKVFMGTTLPNI